MEKKEFVSATVAGFIAAVVSGVLLKTVLGINVVGYLGSVSSPLFLGGGWVMYIVYGVGFALLFAAFVSRYTNAFVDFVLMITKRFDFLASTLTVLVTKYGFTTTTVTLGMMYSVLVWLVAGALLIPLWLSFVGASATPVPNFSPTLLVAHLVYGVLLGSLYGFLLQDVLRSRL